ncbi:MAG: cobalamin-dependent protein [Sedimentisphaerales bacterium]|nr:cobalamin-dependent protein [Sedimentisphaerales bacterium]
MLVLININKMVPPIAPIGLDYMATAVRNAGIEVDILDLGLSDDDSRVLRDYFTAHDPQLVGISFRNVDDCFWPNAEWFVPGLTDFIKQIRDLTSAGLVLGGVGFSIFGRRIMEYTGADYGIRGDGEQAVRSLLDELQGAKRWDRVEGLIWPDKGVLHSNAPAWPEDLSLPVQRNAIDNSVYFRKGGQIGLETKRGCNRPCLYCADPLAKGTSLRLRAPQEVADEAEILLGRGVDVLHLCDSEFNIPRSHALAVCEEFNRRSIGNRLRWYTYMAVLPFDAELARVMRQAGCVGINFTSDSTCESMLKTYRQAHGRDDLESAVRLCRENGIKVMCDLLLGGPGETPETLTETINFFKQINPDAAGAALGVRIYPDTGMAQLVRQEGVWEDNKNIRRKYDGPVDFFKPTFYISSSLGQQPAELVRDVIGNDERFFEPMLEIEAVVRENNVSSDHNYNNNITLMNAIEHGARGAYWDILRQLRRG